MISDGKKIAADLYTAIGRQLEGKIIAFVSFGDTPQSMQFIRMKVRAAEMLGIETQVHTVSVNTSSEAIEYIQHLQGYDGIVVQLPLPKALAMATQEICDAVPVAQDIDALSSKGCIPGRIAPVVRAVDTILSTHGILKEGIVLLGKGMLVGGPLYDFYTQKGIALTVLDHTTSESVRRDALKNASVIISGIGIPWSITPDMISEGVVLIDAGTSEQGGVVRGDIDPRCAEKARLITPVPGGVGPITVASLFYNMLYTTTQ